MVYTFNYAFNQVLLTVTQDQLVWSYFVFAISNEKKMHIVSLEQECILLHYILV